MSNLFTKLSGKSVLIGHAAFAAILAVMLMPPPDISFVHNYGGMGVFVSVIIGMAVQMLHVLAWVVVAAWGLYAIASTCGLVSNWRRPAKERDAFLQGLRDKSIHAGVIGLN